MKNNYRWQVLALAVLMQALVIGVGFFSFAFFVVPWVDEFSVSRGTFLQGYMGMTIMSGVVAAFSGPIIDHMQSRWIVTAGTVAFSAGLLLIAIAPSALLIIMILTLVLPMGMSLSGPLMAQTLVAQAFDKSRGMALGICALGVSLGGFVMPVCVTTLLGHLQWRTVLIVLALLISGVMLPLVFLVLKPRPVAAKLEGAKSGMPTRELLRNPDVFLLGTALFVPSGLFIGVLPNIGLYAQDLAVSQREAGLIVSMTSILMAVGKFTAGTLADRCKHQHIYYALAAMVGTGLLLTASADSFAGLAAGVLLLGATAGGVSPLIAAVAAHRFGAENFGRAMGLILALNGLSGAVPFIAGWLRDITGSYELSFLLFVPLLVPAVFCFSRLRKIDARLGTA